MRTESKRQQLLDAILVPEAEWEGAARELVRRGARRRRYTRQAKRLGVLAFVAAATLFGMRPEDRPPQPGNVAQSGALQVVRTVPLPPAMVVRSLVASVPTVRTSAGRTDFEPIEDDELLRLAPRGAILVRYENRTAQLIQTDAAVH